MNRPVGVPSGAANSPGAKHGLDRARQSFGRRRWADAFRLAHQQDQRPWDQMHTVLVWSQRDSFWCRNIMSAAKFREQYDQLRGNMTGAGKTPTAHGRPSQPSKGEQAALRSLLGGAT